MKVKVISIDGQNHEWKEGLHSHTQGDVLYIYSYRVVLDIPFVGTLNFP